jgi:hypothetical protein
MADQAIELSKPKLSGWDNFFKISAIFGLLVDGISLVTFVTGIWSIDVKANETQVVMFLVVSILVIFYVWVGLSWSIAKSTGRPEASTSLVGLLTYPLFVVWAVAVSMTLSQETAIGAVVAVIPGLVVYFGIGAVISSVITEFIDNSSLHERRHEGIFKLVHENPPPDIADSSYDWLLMADYLNRVLIESYANSEGTSLESIETIEDGIADLTFTQFENGEMWHIAVRMTATGKIIAYNREFQSI